MSVKNDLTKSILSKYAGHPDFIGMELIEPNQRGAVDDGPLHIAARRGTSEDVLDLINIGAKVNLPGDLGNTPLHYAALVGRPEIVKLLLNKGANKDARNEFMETPLKVAQQGGKHDVVELLSEA